MFTPANVVNRVSVGDALEGMGVPVESGEGYSTSRALKKKTIEIVVADDGGIPGSVASRYYESLQDQRLQELEGNRKNNISQVGSSLSNLGIGMATVGSRIAMYLGRWALGVARTVIWNMGRFVVARLIVPILTGLASLVTTPIGLGAVALVAAGGVGYWLYKSFFRQEDPDTLEGKDFEERYGKGASLMSDETWARRQAEYDQDVTSVQDPSYSVQGSAAKITHAPTGTSDKEMTKGQAILAEKRSDNVRKAIEEASEATGVPAPVLNAIAYKESTFDPTSKAPTSTAKGLFQFLDRTWNLVLDRYGKKYGIPADADPYDPRMSALAGAIYLKHEIYPQISKVRANPSATDLYLGHFMGPTGGRKWLGKLESDPTREAYLDWPKQAKANRWVYFNKDETARSYEEIYAIFSKGLSMIESAETKTQVAALEAKKLSAPEITKPEPQKGTFGQTLASGGTAIGKKPPAATQAIKWKGHVVMANG